MATKNFHTLKKPVRSLSVTADSTRLHTILQPRDSLVKFLEVVGALANVT